MHIKQKCGIMQHYGRLEANIAQLVKQYFNPGTHFHL